jgi:hypothetical protein
VKKDKMLYTVFLEMMVYFKAQNNFVTAHFSNKLEQTTKTAQQATIKSKLGYSEN